MNTRGLWRGVLIAVLVIGAAAAIGIGSYNAGVAHGIVESGRAAEVPPGAVPYQYAWHHHPSGWGFFPFFLFFFFFLMRGLVWGGPWRGRWRYRYDGVPPAFEEWHRRAHAETPPAAKP